jgi:hypothetical protein
MIFMKMAIPLLSVILLVMAGSLFAQTNDDSVVQIVTYWEPGDSHRYLVEIGTEMSYTSGDSESFSSYQLLLEVLERTDTGYLVQWTYSESTPPAGATAFEKRVVEISESAPVRFYITDLGEFIGVENWAEIAGKVNDALAKMMVEFAAEPNIADSVTKIMEAFETKEKFESLAMEEIQLYHMLHGYSYMMDDPLIVDGETTNPFGGEPIPATTTIELSEIDKDKGMAYLIYNRGYEQAALARVIFEAVNGYLPDGELTDEQTKDLPNLDMKIKKQFIFHAETGWLLEAYSERYVETEGETRIDSIYIEFQE